MSLVQIRSDVLCPASSDRFFIFVSLVTVEPWLSPTYLTLPFKQQALARFFNYDIMAHLTLWSFVTFATLALLLLVSFAPSHLSVVASPLPEPQQRGGRRGPARGGAARQRGPPPARARGGAGGRGRQGGGAGRGRGRGAPPPPPPPPPADPAQIELAREQARQRAIDLALQRGIDPNNEGELAAIIDELIENVDNGFEV